MRRPRSAHRKTQTPIAAKQTLTETGYNILVNTIKWNLRFYQILKMVLQKGYSDPEKIPVYLFIKFVSQYHYSILFYTCQSIVRIFLNTYNAIALRGSFAYEFYKNLKIHNACDVSNGDFIICLIKL